MVFRNEWIFNPFHRIAGGEALLAGFGIMLVSACIAWPAGTHFDGALDVHAGSGGAPAWVHFLEPVLAWACTVLLFALVAALGAGRRFRLVDLAGTLALSRAPFLLAAPLGFILPEDVDPLHPGAAVLLSAIPLIGISVWTIILMYHAFRISVNPKAGRAGWLFAAALILAELNSKVAFNLLYQSITP